MSDNHVVTGDAAEETKGSTPAEDDVTQHHMHHESDFNLQHLKYSFTNCIAEDGSIQIVNYIEGYEELYKFLNLLGTVFGWVSTDVDSKLQILRDCLKGPNGQHYKTAESMLEYEVENQLIKHKAKDCNTGARNLLRLHRALEYIMHFLEVVQKLGPNEKCCEASQATYKKTLMKFHPWIVQKAALLAMRMLPIQSGLVEKISGSPLGTEKYEETLSQHLPNGVKVMLNVYNRTQELYQQHGLLNLP